MNKLLMLVVVFLCGCQPDVTVQLIKPEIQRGVLVRVRLLDEVGIVKFRWRDGDVDVQLKRAGWVAPGADRFDIVRVHINALRKVEESELVEKK